jgi:hypothetical protein
MGLSTVPDRIADSPIQALMNFSASAIQLPAWWLVMGLAWR